ncbi:SDR family NAD(P)-dependent oxidoreductase [Chitinophaga solisilvae]|uniref:SDR family NAD(P)-dependent oxidoreductase n=1 Tax=Chitinophaga solisilvae TaxID=1233460 RepID=UPI00136DAD5A|nr:SDR family NAD(P)-dependent oxidoreductase [Chitinophaga solisilvae]
MLSVLNNYAHGFAAIPVIASCIKRGLFHTLNERPDISFTEVTLQLQANPGYLRIALHMLESMGWLVRNSQDGYRLSVEADQRLFIPPDIMELMHFPWQEYLQGTAGAYSLEKWISAAIQQWHAPGKPVSIFLDGMLVLPLLLSLRKAGLLQEETLFSALSPQVKKELTVLFLHKGWAVENAGGIGFSDTGRYLAERIFIAATLASYRPMLQQIDEVIFGDCKTVFERDESGSERHVDRTLNVQGSGFQHEKYFSDMEDIIIGLFNREPLDQQPRYIADMGCGNGTLLKKLYRIVQEKTIRGKALDAFPLTLIGADYNNEALAETAITLKDIDHRLVKSDIGDPARMIADLQAAGITDVENILHVRSFLDHDRPYIPAGTAAAVDVSAFPCNAVFTDVAGKEIPLKETIKSLIAHLQRWSAITGRHGLALLEVHCLPPAIVHRFLDRTESLHFDTYHRFSQQLLVEANTFIMAAAYAGLFPHPAYFGKYPRTMPFSRITLSYLERRNYTVRYARPEDLPALIALEAANWAEHLCTPAAVVHKRLEIYPEGQLVLEMDGEISGVIYSQRIMQVQELQTTTIDAVDDLHQKDGHIIQLMGLYILPRKQYMNLGDQLLEFMLQLCSLLPGVETVAGITRCKDYEQHQGTAYADYIHLRNDRGTLTDTTLRFHAMHGARILSPVPGYRPKDTQNKGFGVLLTYDLYRRERKDNVITAQPEPESVYIRDKTAVTAFITDTILFILRKPDRKGFSLERPLMEMGLDSADLLELSERISREYNIPLEPSFFFEHSSGDRIISYLIAGDSARNRAAAVKEATAAAEITAPGHTHTDVAIIGVACRLPGNISNKEQFWELLKEGRSAIGKMPEGRWQWPATIDPVHTHKGIDQGGYLEEIAAFDPSFFRITPKEAELMDPQQRFLLEMTWECMEHAGYPAKSFAGSDTGVFIGASGADYSRLLDQHPESAGAHYGIGSSMSMLPNRLSYFYDLHGPSMQLDTACSSSLLAVHEAVKSIRAGECTLALAGGIHLMCHPANGIAYYKAGMLSPDGKCSSFDEAANGYVRGEGAVVLLLKPLQQAQQDKDHIYAVIKGSATNHGGLAGGITVPNPVQHAGLLSAAFRDAGVLPQTISYIETHGTGTSLGDPIEIAGLKEAFAGVDITAKCALGAVKTNIGHLEAAAGIAGLLKVLLCMQHKQLPASLHFRQQNKHFSITGTPFFFIDRHQPWLQHGPQPVRAGVSSFGSGGTNVHVVLEEAPVVTTMSAITPSPCYLICLSARTTEALLEKQQQLLHWLEQEEDNYPLAAVAATLLLRRDHFHLRAAYVVSDLRMLKEKLMQVLSKGQADAYFQDNTGEKGRQLQPLFRQLGQSIIKELQDHRHLAATEYSDKLMALAELYVKGYELNWKSLSDEMPAVPLPVYPFTRERYWIPEQPVIPVIRERINEKTAAVRRTYFLEKQWESAALVETPVSAAHPPVIISVADTQRLAEALTRHFPGSYIVNADADLIFHSTGYSGCIDLTGCSAQMVSPERWLPLLQQLAAEARESGHLLLAVSRGLEAVQDTPRNRSGALAAGLFRMLQSEYRQLRSRHMDVAADLPDSQLASLIAQEYYHAGHEAEVAYRNGVRYQSVLSEAALPVTEADRLQFNADEVLLITGGTRGIGLLCAKHFISRYGVKKLILLGRRPLSPDDPQLASIAGLGVQVEVITTPLTDQHALEHQLAQLETRLGRIAGVIHSAGLLDPHNPAFIRKRKEDMEAVLSPKTEGLSTLYRIFGNRPLRCFVLFSSVSAIIPSLGAGQADYAMANAWMDYLSAAHTGISPLVSIQWPSWKEIGIGEITSRAYQDTGLLTLLNTEGLSLLDQVLQSGRQGVIMAAVASAQAFKPAELLHFPAVTSVAKTSVVHKENHNGASISSATTQWLLELFSEELKIPVSKLDADTAFQDYGVDSILLSQLLRRINQEIAAPLDPSLLFEYPTLSSLSGWLVAHHAADLPVNDTHVNSKEERHAPPAASPAIAPVKQPLARFSGDIAVVGMSCRFAGADNLDAYWDLLSAGRSGLAQVSTTQDGRAVYGGMLQRKKTIDPDFFLIPPADAAAMDPQALLLLEESLRVIYHAGYHHTVFKDTRTGVYIGGRSQHQPSALALSAARNPVVAVGQNYLAANISQFFDLRGPAVVVDTACSSALVSLHMACQALQTGDIDTALAGGVSLLESGGVMELFEQRGLLNNGPFFHVFDQRAAGVLLSEGAGMVMLKRVEDAEASGDHIYGVIRAVAVNNDGRTAGPASPNLQAQKAVMQEALQRSGYRATDITYIEANGSGTEVTDLLELKAVSEVYRNGLKVPCGLGCIKPNIGHPLCAEGMAGLIKVLLMLHHREQVPFLSGQQAMRYYDFTSSPFEFSREHRSWAAAPAVAGLNCFADGGTNVHVIITTGTDIRNGSGTRQPLPLPDTGKVSPVHNPEKVSIENLQKTPVADHVKQLPMIWETF